MSWRDLIYVPPTSMMQGAAVAVLSTIVQAVLAYDPTKFTSVGAWVFSVVLGAAMAGISKLQGAGAAK
jgi:hypothetical protein